MCVSPRPRWLPAVAHRQRAGPLPESSSIVVSPVHTPRASPPHLCSPPQHTPGTHRSPIHSLEPGMAGREAAAPPKRSSAPNPDVLEMGTVQPPQCHVHPVRAGRGVPGRALEPSPPRPAGDGGLGPPDSALPPSPPDPPWLPHPPLLGSAGGSGDSGAFRCGWLLLSLFDD